MRAFGDRAHHDFKEALLLLAAVVMSFEHSRPLLAEVSLAWICGGSRVPIS